MKITFTEPRQTFITSFQLHGKLNKTQLLEDKRVGIDVDFETKTRLHITFSHRDYRVGLNVGIAGFKTVEKKVYSYFHGDQVKNFFVLSKRQGVNELKEYIIKCIELFFNSKNIVLDELEVVLSLPKELK